MSEQNKDAELAAFEAYLIARWKNQHPVAFSVPEDAQSHLTGMMLERRDDGEYDNLVPREAWAAWQARASLPVGVPDESMVEMAASAYDRAAHAGATHEQAWHEALSVALSAPAAPTVKAEQVEPVETYAFQPGSLADLLFQLGERGVGVSGGTHGDRWQVRLPNPAPSLPAAGSAGEEVEVVGYRIYWPAVGMEPAKARTVDASEYESKKPVFHTCVEPVMTVAQHNRIVAALSAQQSAPELVSVPVEFRKVADKILSKLIRFADCAEDFEAGGVDIGRDWLDTMTHLGLLERIQRSPALWQTTDEADAIIDAQRAILASHGRGEA